MSFYPLTSGIGYINYSTYTTNYGSRLVVVVVVGQV